MVNKKPFSKNIFLTLLVILIVSMFLMMNVSPLASPINTPSSTVSTSSTPLWGFDGAYMNYSVVQSTNFPPQNISSIAPQWFFNGAYANYTFKLTSSSTTTGNYNATIFHVNTTSLTYSVKYIIIKTVSGSSTHSTVYANNTSVAANIQPIPEVPENGTPFPALSSQFLYFMDSGILPVSGMTIKNAVNFTALNKTVKSDHIIMNTSSINESYYVSYGSGLMLNDTLNTSIPNFSAQITATNVPLSSPPPFTVGMMTSTSYAKYKILSTAPNGNFTANVTTTTTVFSIFEPGNFNGTFQNPENLPALNLTDLNQLNAGKVPPGMDMPAKNVTAETGVTVTVPGGTFISDKISGYSILGNNTTKFAFYISSTSGVFILGNFNFSMSDNGHTMIMNESLSLSSTNIPMESTGYGFLKGTITPTGATLVINGMIVPTYNGASYNISLKPGNYYVSASKSGYQTKTYNVNISAGKTTQLNVILASISNSVTLSGHVTPVGSSVLVDGYMASVNATGYYTISVPAGEHTVSVYHDGYFPTSKKIDITSSMTLNFNLLKEPSKVSSNMTRNATTAIGYNVTVSDVLDEKGFVAVNFTATKNGTLLVSIPYNDMKNATISEVLNSSIYINGVKDKNFSITITSNYTVILKVYNLSGDPTLYWTYSPAAVLPTAPPPPFRLSILEEGIIIGAIVAVVALVGVIIVRKKNR